jgi:hypothetical protein
MYALPQKMYHLYETAIATNQLQEADEQLYEQIETRIQRAVKYANNHCRKV